MHILKNQLKIILLFSIFAIIAAYFIEYVLKHQPCSLCLIERVPYFFSIILIIFFFIFKSNQKIILLVLSINFLLAFIISFYHFGIEQGIFNDSIVCKIEAFSQDLSKEELLKSLTKKTVSCKEVTFRIAGMSLATINTFISLALSAIIFKGFINYEKDK
tara:strand:- start:159 stop:638 length:480 start_codon:yes stop_codon:yes gene_type:complete